MPPPPPPPHPEGNVWTPPWRSGYVGQHLSGADSSPAGSVGRDLNLQKLKYQCLTTSVAVVLVVRCHFNLATKSYSLNKQGC